MEDTWRNPPSVAGTQKISAVVFCLVRGSPLLGGSGKADGRNFGREQQGQLKNEVCRSSAVELLISVAELRLRENICSFSDVTSKVVAGRKGVV